ncbi:MAG: hypothetical protein V7647_192 [Acidobacteriota bacterium]|jgi:hypothetical protein
MPTLSCLVLTIWALAGHSSAAAERPPAPDAPVAPSATAIRVEAGPDDALWQTAQPITHFLQRDPKEGAEPSFRTEARVAYDSTALYIAVNAFDPEPQRIVGIRTRRDEESPSDWIGVVVDSFHDRRSGYEFAVNPAGVKQDAYWYNDTNNDPGWDAVWDVTVSRTAGGWRAEFRIPFSQLRYRPSDSATFGLAVIRKVGRLNETSTWPLLAKSASGYVSSFGDLTGLRLNQSPKRLEVVPYVVGNVKTQPVEHANALSKATDPAGSGGVDLKYALKSSLTLTGTINPDFGQVEADPAVVNLSAFETFFSERRPFFVEGSGIFQMDIDCNDGSCSGLFYSRRIGRSPRGSASVPEGGFSSAPAQTTILGAGKLTGRLGAFSIGALSAVTSEENAVIVNGSDRTRQAIEPMTGYNVIRARREFKNQSSFGFMATATNRKLDDATRFLPGQAYTGGADFDWRLNRKYAVQGFFAGSDVRGGVAAIDELQRNNVHSFQRPDSRLRYDPTRTSLNGYGGSARITKIGGQRVRFFSSVGVKSPGFEINDLGFMQRADSRTMSNWVQVRYETPSKYLRSFRYNLNQWAGWNADGDRLQSGGNVNAHVLFKNNWGTGMGVTVNARSFDDRATRGGPGVYSNPRRVTWGYVSSDERPAVAANVFMAAGGDSRGSTFLETGPSVSYRPSSFLKISEGVNFNRNYDDSQWIEESAGHYVFGRIRQKTVGLQTRVNYTITPRLSIQIYAEPFVSAGKYSDFKALTNGRAAAYEQRYAPFAYSGNPDFNYRSFRTTNVLRWEYKPGSTLFAVWQQGREATLDRGTFDFSRDFHGVFSSAARNVFLVKWAYWLNY